MSAPKASAESAGDDVTQRTNGRREGANGNESMNNNQDEYKLDMKSNGSDKVAEDDPLTGRRRRQGSEGGAKEPKWSQRFASTNFFMLIFLLAYVLQGKFWKFIIITHFN